MAEVIEKIKKKMSEIHPARLHFVYDAAAGKNRCKHCQSDMKGNHASNLLRHLESKHREVFEEIYPNVAHNNRLRKNGNGGEPEYVSVRFNLNDLKKSMVAFCTVDGRPYSIMEDNGMGGLLKPIYDACSRSDIPFRINRHNIRGFCEDYRKKLHSIIEKETKKKMITVQMDVVTAQDR